MVLIIVFVESIQPELIICALYLMQLCIFQITKIFLKNRMDSENIVQYFFKKIEWTRNRIEYFAIYPSSIACFAGSFYKTYNFDGNIKHNIFLPDFDIIL